MAQCRFLVLAQVNGFIISIKSTAKLYESTLVFLNEKTGDALEPLVGLLLVDDDFAD